MAASSLANPPLAAGTFVMKHTDVATSEASGIGTA